MAALHLKLLPDILKNFFETVRDNVDLPAETRAAAGRIAAIAARASTAVAAASSLSQLAASPDFSTLISEVIGFMGGLAGDFLLSSFARTIGLTGIPGLIIGLLVGTLGTATFHLWWESARPSPEDVARRLRAFEEALADTGFNVLKELLERFIQTEPYLPPAFPPRYHPPGVQYHEL